MITNYNLIQFDCQVSQDNEDILDEGLEDISKPDIDFSEWNDDLDVNVENSKGDKTKF